MESDLPLWDIKHPGAPLAHIASDRGSVNEVPAEVAAVHAEPAHADHWTKLPLLTAIAVLVVGIGLLTSLLVSVLGIALLLILAGLWMSARWTVPEPPVMPRQRFTALGSGILLFIGSETVLFGALVGADLHLRIHGGLTLGIHGRLPTTLPIVNTVILMTSGIAAHYALTSYRKGRVGLVPLLHRATIILGIAFLADRPGSTRMPASACRAG